MHDSNRASVSSSVEQTLCFVSLQHIIIAVTTSLRNHLIISICSIFPLCVESNALKKSSNKSVASTFFARTSSMI